ncbi:protein THEM6 [Chrysoperla carnea]|uniref:protein THEM6 n=1 Tax=Chrysoperla carnea TaxID=189513 RepID=UPI001D062446|nr:protein THEM6 [Chrysoperla carnea]
MVFCYLISGLLAFVLLIYVSLEFHYFLRMAICVILAKFFKRKVHILQETKIKGICLTTDIDTLLYHMNNARYLREIDFARVDFYERTKLYQTIRSKGGAIVQGACTIRYRRFIRPFTTYDLTTKLIYWDDKSFYFEHRFISNDFVRAIAICRQRLINCNTDDIMAYLMSTDGMPKGVDIEATVRTTKPEMPLEVMKWNESNEISSANLRNGC